MAVKALMLRKKIDGKRSELAWLLEKDTELERREAELIQAVEEARTEEEKQVVEESDSTVYSEQTFGLLEKTDCPAVLVEQCFVTSEADVAAWGTDDGCRRAARLYYEAICEYFGTEPLPGT